MINEVIKTGRTIEEALSLGCDALGKSEEDVSYEIIDMPKKGFFGFGNSPAKVRVYFEISKSKVAVAYLKSLLDNMGISDYSANVSGDDDTINITLVGDNLGVIIGRRGETLDAIQYLVSLVANKIDNKYTRITIDSGNYREKREKTLQSLARKIAANAVETGRTSTLEPMNPYERRIIHAAVAQIEGATSTSVGDEPNRKVVISSANAKKMPYNKDRHSSNGGYKGKRPYNNNKPVTFKPNNTPRPVVATAETIPETFSAPVTPPPEVAQKPLYSKIEL